METLPFGETLAALFQFSLPLLAFLSLPSRSQFSTASSPIPRALETRLNRRCPRNCINHQMLSFLYVQRVVDTKSLTGRLGS